MQGENGELAVCYQGEWAYYEAHFLTNLKESGITFTDKQIKQLIGGRGIKGFTFGRYLTLRKVQAFSYEHERTPRQSIRGNVKKISLSELRERAEKGDKEAALLAEELKLGQQLASALQRWPTDSPEYKELKALYDQFRNTVASKSTEELYQDLLQHIRDEHPYPPSYGSYLYRAIHARLRYYQSTMTADGKYVDPYLQKIYELKLWNDRVKRGEVDWNKLPGLFKKHRLRISEMREQMRRDSTLQDAIKETSKELDKLPAEELQAIEQMADKMFTVWEDFDTVWWEQNRDNIITTPQTQLAFETIRRTVRNQEPGGANAHISDVLEQVNNMQLGEDGADYYRVIYRGDNPRIPRAEDFHNVLETKGIPQEQSARAYKLNSPHISLDGDMDMVSTLVVKEGVSNTEISSVIDALTPAGWEVRLGAHELLSQIKKGQIHIHIEKIVPTTEEYAMDVSQVLQVDLRALTNGQNPQQIAKTLRYLFTRYLKEDGYQALDNIQRAFQPQKIIPFLAL